MRRFWAIFKKEFRQVRRDPLSLGLLVFIPALLLVLYGYALSFDVKHIRMGVLNEDGTRESRELLDSLFRNPYFDLALVVSRRAEADALLSRGRVRGVLVIPKGYAEALARGETARVQVLVDGADANSASTAVGYMEWLAERMSRKVRAEALSRAGLPMSLPVVTAEPRVWFNPEVQSAHFLVPGLIALLLMLAAVIATSLSIVREKERETMEQIMVSPVTPRELILGKTLPYVLICLLTMGLVLLLGNVLFGIEIKGSYLLLGLATLIFLLAALGMGILISSVTNSQQVAFQISSITTLLPSIVLSGLIFPIKNMPPLIQVLTNLIIPRHFVTALRGIILKGADFGAIWPSLLALALLGILYNLLAARLLRRSL